MNKYIVKEQSIDEHSGRYVIKSKEDLSFELTSSLMAFSKRPEDFQDAPKYMALRYANGVATGLNMADKANFSDEVFRIPGSPVKGGDLVVMFEHPPIPDRSMDYSAYYADNYDEEDPIGRGATPEEAIKDFYDLLSSIQ